MNSRLLLTRFNFLPSSFAPLFRVAVGFLLFTFFAINGHEVAVRFQLILLPVTIIISSVYLPVILKNSQFKEVVTIHSLIHLVIVICLAISMQSPDYESSTAFFLLLLFVFVTFPSDAFLYHENESEREAYALLYCIGEATLVFLLSTSLIFDLGFQWLMSALGCRLLILLLLLRRFRSRFWSLKVEFSRDLFSIRVITAFGTGALASFSPEVILLSAFIRLKTVLDVLIPYAVRNSISMGLSAFIFILLGCYAVYLKSILNIDMRSEMLIFFAIAVAVFVTGVYNQKFFNQMIKFDLRLKKVFYMIVLVVVGVSVIMISMTPFPYLYYLFTGLSVFVLSRKLIVSNDRL
jgi:hypothetical protein